MYLIYYVFNLLNKFNLVIYMKPEKWGPFIWYLIHIITFYIPNDEFFIINKKIYLSFFRALNSIIPCPICRSHLNKMIKTNNLDKCNSKEDIINWTIKIHNLVNQRLKKKQINKEKSNELYKDINIQKIFQGIDILTYNFQQKMPLKQYITMFTSFKTIFPNDEFKQYYNNSLKKYKINFRNHNEMIIWYKNIGKHINKQFNK